MEQEPGKAGEPVPAAPHPNDVPTFEPQIGSEHALENGSVPLESAPVFISAPETLPDAPEFTPSAPPPTFESPAADASPLAAELPAEPIDPTPGEDAAASNLFAAPDDATAPVPPSAEPISFLEAEPPPPAPALNAPDWDFGDEMSAFPDAAERGGAEEGVWPLAPEALPPFAETAPETAETTGVDARVFPAEPPPPPVFVSAWGPPPPAWPLVGDATPGFGGVPPSATPSQGTAALPLPEVQPVAEESYVETGPNWMLAFVCLWAAGTALNEAWFLALQVGLTPALLRNITVMGYGVLGLGLIGFALDALSSGKKQSPAASIVKALIPALLTLAGVILLVLSNDPGRRI